MDAGGWICPAVLKDVFKGAATTVLTNLHASALCADYQRSLASGVRPNLAKLTLARRIASVALSLWKKGDEYRG